MHYQNRYPHSKHTHLEPKSTHLKGKRIMQATIFIVGSILGGQYLPKDIKISDIDLQSLTQSHNYFDVNNQIFFEPHLQYKKEIHIVRSGEKLIPIELIKDAKMYFYIVQSGDNRKKIIDKISQIEQFSYLQGSSSNKTQSFNIHNRDLKIGMYIPIPLNTDQRRITDEQLRNYSHSAIKELLQDKKYGNELEKLVDNIGTDELIQSILAVAKSESGGKNIGDYSYHRRENNYRSFSFTLFHILMDGPGFQARKHLGLTEGQLYHPINACKLFLIYLLEKVQQVKGFPNKADQYFPLSDKKNADNFARIYNGNNKSTYPAYSAKLQGNYYSSEQQDFYQHTYNIVQETIKILDKKI